MFELQMSVLGSINTTNDSGEYAKLDALDILGISMGFLPSDYHKFPIKFSVFIFMYLIFHP